VDRSYKQICGGAMDSAFAQVLANIYMLEWEQNLIQHQTIQHEIYGRLVNLLVRILTKKILSSNSCRYIDDIFMTTNKTIIEIDIELKKAKNKDINIKLDPNIGTSIHFLDVTITNENGQLRTSIYHKPTVESYILSYTSDHPRHIHRNIPYTALLRAARICSDVSDFNSECIRIDISLLLNNYPLHFITQQFNRFFHLNNAMPVWSELNEQVYSYLHQN
jgi:hypothetical protein